MRSLLVLSMCLLFISSMGQLIDEMKATEEELNASTKQINQFFRRFNGEEDQQGERFYEGDKGYRDLSIRKKYLPGLFDAETGTINDALAKDFMRQVTDKKLPQYLDFHQSEWFAEVTGIFTYKGREINVLLYMKLQAQGQGYEWVIDDVAADPFKKLFNKDTTDGKRFMHPMSHELGFMTLRKALQDEQYPEQFTSRSYRPDYLTLFLYELKLGNLKFKTVRDVKFHLFNIPGWYFELSNFNRSGFNSGWLISNLVKLEGNQKQLLKDYIYDKN